MMSKGADSIMIPRCVLSQPAKEQIEKDLYYFATQGLRTLLISKKKIEEDVYKEWSKRFFKVSTSNDKNKEDQLNELYDELEYGLTYLGCTAIEDLL